MTHSFILKFGKYKGQNFNQTPVSYQNWLLSQDWFKAPALFSSFFSDAEKVYSDAAQSMLKSNYSEKSIESMFHAEVALQDAYDTAKKYAGMNYEQKQSAMIDEAAEAAADNDIYNYYN
jgi:hypothetical protein